MHSILDERKRAIAWSSGRVKLLREHWGKGKTAGQIASILGEVTRNAVIGKAHRLGLSGRPSPIRRREKERVTIRTLGEGMCRWPIGDPKQFDFHFCAKMVYSGFSYCGEHVTQAYQSPGKRQSDRRRPSFSGVRPGGRIS